MRLFLDTEFIESGPYKPIQLISIGIVTEDDRTYYAISNGFYENDANQWVKDNVLNNLETIERKSLSQIATEIIEFTKEYETIEFWGYYSDYDWVVFCQIFGTMMDLPESFPMYCRDLKQLCDQLGNPRLPEQSSKEHNALNDAKWNKEIYNFLSKN